MLKEELVFNEKLISEFEKKAKQEYIKVSDGSEIKILITEAPKEKANGFTLLLIPGWGTVIPGWENVLAEAINDFNILYIESREKSSFIPGKGRVKNNVERLALDVKEILDQLEINQDRLVVLTSSFSTLTIANLLGTKKINPFLSILIGPVYRLNMPPATRYLMYLLPNFVFTITKPIWRWWLKKFKSEDKIQYAKYMRVLDESDPKKWRAVAKHTCLINVQRLYEKIENPNVIVIGMEKDKMHAAKTAKEIAEIIKNAKYIDVGTNLFAHSREMVEEIRKIINKIEKNQEI
ncbi:MAG: hypothetical protein ACTSSF_13300 [Candidatus Heimdallarchaeaceae archaeon]